MGRIKGFRQCKDKCRSTVGCTFFTLFEEACQLFSGCNLSGMTTSATQPARTYQMDIDSRSGGRGLPTPEPQPEPEPEVKAREDEGRQEIDKRLKGKAIKVKT